MKIIDLNKKNKFETNCLIKIENFYNFLFQKNQTYFFNKFNYFEIFNNLGFRLYIFPELNKIDFSFIKLIKEQPYSISFEKIYHKSNKWLWNIWIYNEDIKKGINFIDKYEIRNPKNINLFLNCFKGNSFQNFLEKNNFFWNEIERGIENIILRFL